MNVTLQWATPDADKHIMFMARVSNPNNQNSDKTRLLHYCMEEGHVSPFEMASACLEINTTRDIGRQILRHRSFSFQEFSQRYADVGSLPDSELRECRLQDAKNRQNSVETNDLHLIEAFEYAQQEVISMATKQYKQMIFMGVSKEQARALLPEGLTSSRLYMNGTMRSWIHYLNQRLHPSTQKEHRLIAQEVLAILRIVAPVTMSAFFPEAENGAS